MIRRNTRNPRSGFTLIELMVVIVIIGILLALLLPVIVGAVRKANEARVSAEIQTLAQSLARFKDTYGEYPPSRVILSETGVYSLNGTSPIPNGTDFTTALSAVPAVAWYAATPPTNFGTPDISFGELAQRSRRALQKYFPKAALAPVDLNGDNTINIANDYWPDFNGNAGLTSAVPDPGFIYLEGHECLVFFLGGVPTPTANANGSVTFGSSGFAKDPKFPFRNAGVSGTNISTSNRNPAFFEFKGERLIDPDGDGIPGYLDPNSSGGQGTFYAYFSAYNGVSYDPNDVNFGDDGDLTIGNTYRIGLPTVPVSNPPNTVFSPAPNPYTSTLSLPASNNQPASYINANSFQIIASGGDLLFGPGGQWTTSGDKLPLNGLPSGVRDSESDNITNFTAGRLN